MNPDGTRDVRDGRREPTLGAACRRAPIHVTLEAPWRCRNRDAAAHGPQGSEHRGQRGGHPGADESDSRSARRHEQDRRSHQPRRGGPRADRARSKTFIGDDAAAKELIAAGEDLDKRVIAVEERLFNLHATGRGQDFLRMPSQLMEKLAHLADTLQFADFAPDRPAARSPQAADGSGRRRPRPISSSRRQQRRGGVQRHAAAQEYWNDRRPVR